MVKFASSHPIIALFMLWSAVGLAVHVSSLAAGAPSPAAPPDSKKKEHDK